MKAIICVWVAVFYLNPCISQIYTGCNYGILHRHPANCSFYLQCANGYEYVMPCPEDLVFNQISQRCDFLYNVPECQEAVTTTTTASGTTTVCYSLQTTESTSMKIISVTCQ